MSEVLQSSDYKEQDKFFDVLEIDWSSNKDISLG